MVFYHYFNPTKKKIILCLLLGFIAFLSAIAFAKWNGQKDSITIAVVAPLSNTYEATMKYGQSMVDGVELYINQVNQQGGIKGKRINLQVYDDQFNPKVAEKVAQEIAESQAVAVIGHYSSDASLAAGKIYQEYQIPAVTSTATVDSVTDNDWYFRTIMSNKYQGRFIANYTEKVLKAKKVYLIYGDNSYSFNLSHDIEKQLQYFGRELIGKWQVRQEDNLQVVGQKIVDQLLELQSLGQKPDVIIMASQGYQVPTILNLIKSNNIDSLIIGGDSLTNFLDSQLSRNDDPQALKSQDYFLDGGVQGTSPLLFDISGEEAFNFRNTFRKTYGYDPDWIAACIYDTAGVIVTAIRYSIEQEKNAFNIYNIAQQRLLIREGLQQIDSPQDVIPWATREVYFDNKGDSLTPILLGTFKQGQFISAFTQLKTIKNISLVFDLEDKLASGEIFYDGENYIQKTYIVYTGIDINEISRINERTSSYLIDFYLWFRYKGNINPDEIEFTNYDVERLDSGEKLTLGKPNRKGEVNGVKYAVYHMKADFYELFDFHKYPFDIQSLSIRFHHSNLTKNRLIYVIDLIGMRDKTPEIAIDNFKKNKVLGTITDWEIQKVSFFQDTYTNSSTLGFRRFLDTNAQIRYSRFNVIVYIQRVILSFIMKHLFPLCFFMAVAYSILFLPHEDISADTISALLLAVVFYHLSLLESLPEGIGYVVVLDYAFYLAYFIFCSELLIVILGNNKRVKAMGISEKQLLITGQVMFPIIWISGCLFLYFKYAGV